MYKHSHETPYLPLGNQLKGLRQKGKESMAEVCGAVEIDEAVLVRIETGTERPSEDVLMLLISHFGIADEEAVQLWELAGYESPHNKDATQPSTSEDAALRSVVVMMTLDTRILYSDQAHVAADKNGVVLSFLQNGKPEQQIPIARIGMSYEQAHDLMKILHQTVNQAEMLRQPKALPSPKTNSLKRQKPDTN